MPSKQGSHKKNIINFWKVKRKPSFFSFSFFFFVPFVSFLFFYKMGSIEILVSGTFITFYILFFFFFFPLCWQGRDRKVCRVLWVSAVNCFLSSVNQCFVLEVVGLDRNCLYHFFPPQESRLCISSDNACFPFGVSFDGMGFLLEGISLCRICEWWKLWMHGSVFDIWVFHGIMN